MARRSASFPGLRGSASIPGPKVRDWQDYRGKQPPARWRRSSCASQRTEASQRSATLRVIWPGCCRARGPPSRLGVPAFTRAGRRSRSSALALRSSSRSWLRADRCPGREKSALCNLHHCKNAHESPHAIGEQRSRTPRDDPADNELAHDLSRTRNRRYPDGAAPRSGV